MDFSSILLISYYFSLEWTIQQVQNTHARSVGSFRNRSEKVSKGLGLIQKCFLNNNFSLCSLKRLFHVLHSVLHSNLAAGSGRTHSHSWGGKILIHVRILIVEVCLRGVGLSKRSWFAQQCFYSFTCKCCYSYCKVLQLHRTEMLKLTWNH